MGAPASTRCVSGFTTVAVGCSRLTGTNLGSIWRSQTGHHARLSSISGLSDDLHIAETNVNGVWTRLEQARRGPLYQDSAPMQN